jgi:hypothetical protein
LTVLSGDWYGLMIDCIRFFLMPLFLTRMAMEFSATAKSVL